MKKLIVSAVLAVAILAVVSPAAARGQMAVGGRLGAGFSFSAGPGAEEVYLTNEDDRAAKFSGAFAGYFNYWFTPTVALETGLDFQSQGMHWKNDPYSLKTRHFYMAIPVLVRFDVKNFRIGVGVAVFFALSGKTTAESDLGDDEETWDGDDWDYMNRVNVGPKIDLGYAIPVGPIAIVPSLSWSMHMVNDIDRNAIEDDFPTVDTDEYRSRYNNLLLNVGVEWKF